MVPTISDAPIGVRTTACSTGAAAVTVTTAVSASVPACCTAITRYVPTVASAVNRPSDAIVPPEAAYNTAGECVPPSLHVPATMNCCDPPAITDAVEGVMLSDCSVAALTVRVDWPETEPLIARIIAEPAFLGEARPADDTVAIVVSLETQLIDPPAIVVPAASFKVAENDNVSSTITLAEPGFTVTDATMGAGAASATRIGIRPDRPSLVATISA